MSTGGKGGRGDGEEQGRGYWGDGAGGYGDAVVEKGGEVGGRGFDTMKRTVGSRSSRRGKEEVADDDAGDEEDGEELGKVDGGGHGCPLGGSGKFEGKWRKRRARGEEEKRKGIG